MSENERPMYTLDIPIYQVDGVPHPHDAFDRPFYILGKIHNTLVSEAKRRIDRLYRDKEYRYLLRCYRKAATKSEQRSIVKAMNQIVDSYGLKGRFCLQKYAAVQQHKYKNYLSSHQVQKEGENIYKGIEKVLYKNGKHLHYKKWSDVRTISQKSTLNGVRFNLDTGVGRWGKYTFRCHIDWRDPYVAESLALGEVVYFTIKRRMFRSGWRYYLTIVMKGHAPKKITDLERSESNRSTVGIDLGPSTVAWCGQQKAMLERLVPNALRYEQKIRHLQKRLDGLRRMNNLEYYNEDGTINKGRKKWRRSHTMCRLQREIVVLYRKKSEYVRTSHYASVDEIVRNADHVYYEKNSFTSLQRRAKNTERSDKKSSIKRADGSTIEIKKYKKKKRFGHSIGLHSPSMFVDLLKNRCSQYGVPFDEVNTTTYRASQYDPLTGEYRKPLLSERTKDIGGHAIQRDLLSAYLIAHSDPSLLNVDAQAAYDGFNHFLKIHDTCIKDMKERGITFRQCFGF